MGIIKIIVVVVLLMALVYCFYQAPKTTMNAVVKIGEKSFELVKTVIVESKNVATDVIKKNGGK